MVDGHVGVLKESEVCGIRLIQFWGSNGRM